MIENLLNQYLNILPTSIIFLFFSETPSSSLEDTKIFSAKGKRYLLNYVITKLFSY